MEQKRCSTCGQERPLSEFKRRSGKTGASGRRGMCRSCRTAKETSPPGELAVRGPGPSDAAANRSTPAGKAVGAAGRALAAEGLPPAAGETSTPHGSAGAEGVGPADAPPGGGAKKKRRRGKRRRRIGPAAVPNERLEDGAAAGGSSARRDGASAAASMGVREAGSAEASRLERMQENRESAGAERPGKMPERGPSAEDKRLGQESSAPADAERPERASGSGASAAGKAGRRRRRRKGASAAQPEQAPAGAAEREGMAPAEAEPRASISASSEGRPRSGELPEGATLLPPDKPKKRRRKRRRGRKPGAPASGGGDSAQAPDRDGGAAVEPQPAATGPAAGKAGRRKAPAPAPTAASLGAAGAAAAPSTADASAAEPPSAADSSPADASAPKKRQRPRRRKKPGGAPLTSASVLAEAPPEPRGKIEPPFRKTRPTGGKLDIHDPAALRPTRAGIIRMRGRTDKGRGWYQEVDLEMAATLVREHAAVLVNPHTIRRLYSNKDFRRYILTRDHYTCYFCGEYGDTIDHLVPRAKGGHSTPDNCVCACSLCNRFKADKDVDVFLRSRR